MKWNPTEMILSRLVAEQRAAGWQAWAISSGDFKWQTRWKSDKKCLRQLLGLEGNFLIWFCDTSNHKRWLKVRLDERAPWEVIVSFSVRRWTQEDSFSQVILDLKRWVNAILPAVTKIGDVR